MKIKIIDLLNKIANGEEDDLLTEFKFDSRVWNFKMLNDSEFCLDGWLLNQNITITKHKEILEEPKTIEKILISMDDNSMPFVGNSQYKHLSYSETDLMMATKINEIIDEINNLKEE